MQKELGCTKALAFDLTAACSGFVLGLVTATRFIKGKYKVKMRLLLVSYTISLNETSNFTPDVAQVAYLTIREKFAYSRLFCVCRWRLRKCPCHWCRCVIQIRKLDRQGHLHPVWGCIGCPTSAGRRS